MVVLVSVLGARVASASCGSPRTAVSPPSGAQLPPHPTIYLFNTNNESSIYEAVTITRDTDAAEPIRFRAVKLASGRDYTVHRIELALVSRRDRAIRVSWYGEILGRYSIVDAEQIDRATVVDVRRESSHWTCSYTDVVQVEVEGNAAAYQIEWEDDRTTVVADAKLLWPMAAPGQRSVFEVGHPNCMSFNVEPELLGAPRRFELYALFTDGAVKHVGSSIMQLGEHAVRLPVELIGDTTVKAPGGFEIAITTSPLWGLASWAAGGILGSIALFVARGWRRRRRRHASRL